MMGLRKLLPAAAAAALCAFAVPSAFADRSVEVTTSTLNVRSGPGTGYSVIGEIHRGQVYVRVDISGDWRKIWYSDRTGWVHVDYLRGADGVPHRTVTAGSLNVRTGPGTGYGVIGQAPRGSDWAIVGSSGAWRKIYYRGRAAWAHGSYLGTGASTPTPSPSLPTSRIGFVNLPASGRGFFAYSAAYRRWGTPRMVYGIIRAAGRWRDRYPARPRIAVGDLSLANGGYFPPHQTHRGGLDADIRPIASTGYEGPLTIYSGIYSRSRTEDWIVNFLRPNTTLYQVLFNDPAIYNKYSWIIYFSGHHNHHHADFR